MYLLTIWPFKAIMFILEIVLDFDPKIIFKTRKSQGLPLVETQEKSALEHINLTLIPSRIYLDKLTNTKAIVKDKKSSNT